jgi:hypothetical protein
MRPNKRFGARYRLASQLLDSDDGWITLCREAVAAGTVDDIENDHGYWEALRSDTSARQMAETTSPALPNSPDIARAILNLATALTGHPGSAQLVLDAMETFDRCGHSSPSGFRPQPQLNHGVGMLDNVQAVIENANPDHPSATFTSLLARYLSGDDLSPMRTVVVPVLFDQVTSGSVGHLRISEMRTGPAGIHPHPKAMTFLAVDKQFNQALRDAWAISPLRASNRCFLWELTDAQTHAPVRHVAGASLGAAWYVALDELRRGKFFTLLRPQTLDPNCAATGSLNGTMLASVKGYDNKFQAATENNLRVVYPAVDSHDAERAATRYAATADPAKDAPSAVRAVRNRPNKWAPLIIAVIFVTAILAAVTTGIFYSNQITAAERKETATSLINSSNESRGKDPRLSALLALASHKLMPRPESAMAMANTALSNQFTTAIIHADPGRVVALSASGNMLISSTNKAVRAWNVSSHANLWSIEAESAIYDAQVSPDRTMLAITDGLGDGAKIKFFSISNAGAQLIREVDLVPETGLIPWYLPMNLSNEGNPQLAIVKDNSISVVEFTDQGRHVLQTVPIGQPSSSNTIRTISGEWMQNIRTGKTERLFVLFDGSVYVWNVGGGVEQLIPPGLVLTTTSIDRNYTSASGDVLLVGTLRGTFIWSVSKKSLLQGVSSDPVTSLVTVKGGFATVNSGSLKLTSSISSSADISSYPSSTSKIDRPGMNSLAVVPEGNVLAAATDTGEILLLEPWSREVGYESTMIAEAIAFTPSNDLIVASPVREADSHLVRIANNQSLTGPALQPDRVIYETDSWGIDGRIQFSDLAVDSRYLVGTTTGGYVLIWDASTGKPVTQLSEAKSLPTIGGRDPGNHIEVALVNGGNTLAAFNRQNATFYAWETRSWEKLESIEAGHTSNAPDRMSVSPDGREIAFIHQDRHAVIVDATTGRLKTRLGIGETGAPADPHTQMVWFNSDSNLVVQKDTKTLSVKTFDDSTLTTRRFDVPIRGVIPSPDGLTLAVVSHANQIQLLDARTLENTRPALESLNTPFLPWYASWTRNGEMLATLDSTVGYVNMWFPNRGTWEERMCTIAGSDFTPAERSKYLGPADNGFRLCR